jgi:hypothetical protein
MRGLAVLLLAAGILFMPLPVLPGAPSEHHFRIEASTFEFSPHTIRVKPGDRVTIELLSTDVVHGIALDGHDFEIPLTRDCPQWLLLPLAIPAYIVFAARLPAAACTPS